MIPSLKISSTPYLLSLLLAAILLAGCTAETGPCLIQTPADLTQSAALATGDNPFQFPLEEQAGSVGPVSAPFCTFGTTTRGPEYHAAEDYLRPAGTPVYAIADGDLSFSGRMGGYGWLIIIDHPQFNLYSLYGHLSPSRWARETGPVTKGELIGYLGDNDENGGTAENPMRPHLHLGLRAGQHQDYPGNGQWRWMAGWIKPCPTDTGWLPPSAIITAQEIPPGGFAAPAGHFLAKWGSELLLLGLYVVSAGAMLLIAFRRRQPLILLIAGAVYVAMGLFFYRESFRLSLVIFALAVLLAAAGMLLFLRRRSARPAAPAT